MEAGVERNAGPVEETLDKPVAADDDQAPSLCAMADHYRPSAMRTIDDDLDRMDSDALRAFITSEVHKLRAWTASVANIEDELCEEREQLAEGATTATTAPDPEFYIADGTVLAQGESATRLISRLQEQAGSLGLGMRKLRSLFSSAQFTWADHKLLRPALRDYLESGVSVSNLYKARVAYTYLQLRDELRFMPDDLAVDRSLLSCSHLRLLYGITWQRLLVDYAVGPRDYLLRLRLPLEDLCMLDLSIDVLVRWPWKRVFKEMGREPPGTRAMDPRTVSMRQPLDRQLFRQCSDAYEPHAWTMYMGVSYRTLLDDIGLHAKDPWRLWGDTHFLSLKDMARAFGYRSRSGDSMPFVLPKRPKRTRARSRHDPDDLFSGSDDEDEDVPGGDGSGNEPREGWWPWSGYDEDGGGRSEGDDADSATDDAPLPPFAKDSSASSDSSDSEIFAFLSSFSATSGAGRGKKERAPKKKKKRKRGRHRDPTKHKEKARKQLAVL